MSRSSRIRVGITMGDPAGIGPEIMAKAIDGMRLGPEAQLVLIGDKWVFDHFRGARSSKREQGHTFLDLDNVQRKGFKFGRVNAACGAASIQYIGKAARLIKEGRLDCLVTCPISKEAVALAGFKFPGHTEYLARMADTTDFVMMLMNKHLKISLVTRHIPLKDVSSHLDKESIYKTIVLTYKSMNRLFGIRSPRILVCGLNPHASDNGLLGKEEGELIAPAIKKAASLLKGISGPMPCDSVFAAALKGRCDAVVAMYHDQALIPLKVTDFDSGVNITLGLPYVRTSVLHGTAFDIAGKNKANPRSLIEAIKVAVKCAAN